MVLVNQTLRHHLRECGLTARDATKLGWKSLKSAETIHPSFLDLPAFTIPYFDLSGRPIAVKRYLRVRYLATPTTFKKSPPRYAQLPDSGIRAYLPPFISWRQLTTNPDQRLFITEGEKKSACATKLGFPCIGFGGVWNFRDSITKMLLPELEAFEWRKRSVYVCYDSDLLTNKDVRGALFELRRQLSTRGALVYMVLLGDGESKVGLDDFLIEHGAERFESLLEQAQLLNPELAKLHAYNERFCGVRHPTEIRDFASMDKSWSVRTNSEFRFANPEMMEIPGEKKTRVVSVADEWVKWPERRLAESLVYEPGKSFPILQNGKGFDFNLWGGWGCEPKKGSVDIWLKLLKGLFRGRAEPQKWFEQWLAYPLQFPGAKLYTACFIWTNAQGVGKSAVGNIMEKIYGASYRELADNAFVGDFNSWLQQTSFVMVDDLAAVQPKPMKSLLKRLISQEIVEIHRKFMEPYKSKNSTNFFFTANSSTAIPLDAADNRRLFIIEGPKTRPYPEEWYTKHLDKFIRGNGPRAVFHRLMELDLTGFFPHGDAMETLDRTQAIETSAPELEVWAAQIVADPEQWLRDHGLPENAEILTASQLKTFCHSDTGGDPSSRRVAAALTRNLTKIGQCGQIPDGSQPVFYALKRGEHWRKHHSEARRHFLKVFPIVKG